MNAGALTVSPQDKAHRTGWLLRTPVWGKASQPESDHWCGGSLIQARVQVVAIQRPTTQGHKQTQATISDFHRLIRRGSRDIFHGDK